MASVFTKIVKGEIPSYKITESNNCYSFLDINPMAKGHTIVIPKVEVDYIFDLEDDIYTELFQFAKKIAQGLKNSIDCKRVGVAVIGMEVPHAHIHLIPINSEGDMDFRRERINMTNEEFVQLAEKISKAIN